MNSWNDSVDYLMSNQKFVQVNIWDQKNNLIAYYKDEKNQNDLKKKVLDFLNFWDKQRFKILFRSSISQTPEAGFTHYIDTVEVKEDAPIVEAQNIQGHSNIDVETQIQNGINSALEKIEFKKQKEEVEEKREELKSTAGQIAIVVQQLVQVFAPQFAPMQSPINGTDVEIVDMEITDEEINNALAIIVKHTKKEDLIKIAKAVERDPSLISKAVMMLG